MAIGAALVVGWAAYLGVTGYVLWRIVSGNTPSYLTDYTLGTNALWVILGLMLWLATEWMRGFRS
jgi:apolipoprotein N-acyltransferase